ncbi:hypothetical protein [Yoonia sp. SS1-5]|uniref:Uncharacterized protein n=1 Tax=Yoonia rhodophyticola TaxID=3137370 RepID=A0AAN0MJ85_9RHOB
MTKDNFDHLIASQLAGLSKVGTTWEFGAQLRFKSATMDSFDLSAENDDLFNFLSSIFGAAAGRKTAVTFVQPDISETVVVLHNDPSVGGQNVEMANMRFAETTDILISFDVFQVTFPALFKDIDDGSEPDGDYPVVALQPVAGFILAGFATVTPDNETQAMYIFTNTSGGAAELLQDIACVEQVEEYDEDHYNFSDPDTGLSAEALDFDSDRGRVIEMRFTLSLADAEKLPALLAARLADRPETAHFIVDEDWETFTFQVRPVLEGGALGPAISITYAL